MQAATIEAIYRLSPAQQEIIEAALAGGDIAAHCEQVRCTLVGPLDDIAFSTAWERLLNSHEILRASFVWKQVREPVQVVHQNIPANLEIRDKRGNGMVTQEFWATAEADLAAGIDSLKAPLLRGCLMVEDDSRSHLFITYHRLILDSGSARNFLKQLLRLYAEAKTGNVDPHAGSRMTDYLASAMTLASPNSQLFWREYFSDLSSHPVLLQQRTSPELFRGRRSWRDSTVPQAVASELFALAYQHQIEVSILVDAVWIQLISRYTGVDDVVFRKTASQAQNESANGKDDLFPRIITTPMRVTLGPTDSLLDIAGYLKEQRSSVLRYSYLSYVQTSSTEDLAKDWLKTWASTDVYDNVATWEPDNPLHVETLRSVPLNCGAILLETGRTGDDLTVTVSHESTLQPEFAARLERHFLRLLSEAVRSPGSPFAQLPMLEESERERLGRWSAASTSKLDLGTIHGAFEEQVERAPDGIAVRFGEDRYTYGELNCRANNLAHYLRNLGVGTETAVAICVDRSLEMAVGLLGILKAGGIYVPLDPAWPAERTEFCIRDTAAPVVLCQRQYADRLSLHCHCVISLDSDWPVISKESVAKPNARVSSESAAYIMYTSGSTGVPKGVVVLHQAVVRLVKQADYVRFGSAEVFLLLSPFTFDASTFEIWGALLNGGVLAIMPPHTPTLAEIAQQVEAMKVTKLWLTAGLFHLMVDQQLLTSSGLKELVAGGDALSPYHVRLALESMPNVRLVNGYGPTESTTFACCSQITALPHVLESVPIGRPIANTEAYILDSHLRMVPQGAIGELFLGGYGLARGYLNEPELTASKFIPHPNTSVPGSRLYRTGDKTRFLADGQIEFLGRIDGQVKIRGFRVELAEVETVLRRHPAIRDALVTIFEDQTGRRLAAYLLLEEIPASTEEIQAYMRNRVPEYLVPARIIPLQEFPLTDRGKVDRRKLPSPLEPATEIAAPVEPATERERVLSEIYRSTLGLEKVGVTDNFFVMGGDSMRSIQIISLAEQKGLHLSIDEVFRHQTVRELAHAIQAKSKQPQPAEGATSFVPYALISEEDRRHLPAGIEDAYPLTQLQAGMVFHSELSPHSALYHDILSFHLMAAWHPDLWKKAAQQLGGRHEILRTSFEMRSYREPLQLVHREARIPVEIEDLRSLSSDAQEIKITEWIEQEKKRPFDWSQAPLLRLQLHRRTEETIQLTLSFHHAILDGWSVSRFFTELFEQYSLMVEGQHQDLSSRFPVRFRNLVEMEKKALSSAESKQFWQDLLNGHEVALFPRWPMQKGQSKESESASLLVPLSAGLSEGLLQFAHSAQVPLKSVLFAAHLRVLNLVTGSTDITTGFVTHGRPEASGADEVLGLFLNALPFRAKLTGGTWRDLVQAVFRSEQAMTAHRWYPMSQIQNDLGGEHIYDTAFTFTRFHVLSDLQKNSGVQILTSTSFAKANVLFAPFFQQESSSSQLHLDLDYDPAELIPAQISAMAEYYRRTLESMVRGPLACYEMACLLPESEVSLLLQENNRVEQVTPARTVTELFEIRAKETPEAVALVSRDEQISFRQLNEQSSRLARYLRSIGVGPEVIVGLCLDHCPEMLVALLGILKSGGAFVSIDPGYPLERKSFIFEDSRTPVVVTKRDFADELPFFLGQVVLLDSDDLDAAVDTEEAEISKDVAAYLVYTSGSTGQPKGILVSHESLLNVVTAMIQTADIKPDDRLFQFVSLNFDAAIQQIFITLCGGSSLALTKDASQLTPEALLRTCEELAVNTLYLPPAYWHELVQWLVESGQKAPHWIRQVLCGGEAPSPDRLRTWAGLNQNGSTFLNAYGPAEATVTATAYRVLAKPDLVNELTRVPMGRPIANMWAFVLDTHFQLAPVGTTGELFLSGTGVARGYLGKPDLTGEKFIPNPISTSSGSRMYRTGDLARYLPNGALEFWGRIDSQIKVRGYRVEPAEIEYVLRQDDSVRNAIVFKNDSAGAHTALVACVVANDGKIPSPAALIRRMEQVLPEYMVPRSIFVIPEIPVTATGKTDYKELARLIANEDLQSAIKAGPRNPIEEILSNIWCEVLERESVSIYDNFFDLGGHSLLATQVASRVREALRKDLQLKTLFETPTIAQLAEGLAGIETSLQEQIVRISRDERLPLSFAQQRLWFLDQLHRGNSLYNVMTAFSLKGKLNTGALEKSMTEIVRRHEVLRTTFSGMDSEPRQIITPALPFRIPTLNLRGSSPADRDQEVVRLAQAEARHSFDLTRGPLLRASLLLLDEEENALILTLHHIVADGWSMSILTRELADLYTAFAAQETPELPELPIQYADFAAWQRNWLSGDIYDEQLEYWKTQLEGALQPLELPLDRPRPVVQSSKGGRHAFRIPPDVSRAAVRLGRRHGLSNFMIIFAAFNTVLQRYTGREDVVIGTDIAGRRFAQVEGLIGFFINQLVLRTDLSANPPFMDLLKRVRKTTLDAYAHQDFPFEKLVEVLQPERRLNHHPMFQVKFVYQAPMSTIQLSEISLSFLNIETGVTRYDLLLSVDEVDNSFWGLLEYCSDLFDASTIERMAGHIQTLLTAAVEDPDQRISELPLLTSAELEQMLMTWNRSDAEFETGKCIQELFEEHVKMAPENPAVISDSGNLTYAELNRKANQLASYMRRLGVGPEVPVGICLPRGADMIVAVLGTLKAGGAYVNLDPTLPLDRLSFVMEDTRIPLILTHEGLANRLPATWARVLCLDSEAGLLSEMDDTNLPMVTCADNLAYIIYTSGSSGKPKGTLLQHRGVCNLARWQAREFGITRQSRVSQNFSYNFDGAVGESFMALLQGATLVILSLEPSLPQSLAENINLHRINVGVFVPSLLLLVDPSSIKARPDLTIVSVGEVCPPELVRRWSARCRFINAYGPTEYTVYSHLWEAEEGCSKYPEPIPIGRGISNTRTYIVDRHLNPVPIGVEGEICISGPGLARGYLNQIEITASKFLPNPFQPYDDVCQLTPSPIENMQRHVEAFRERRLNSSKHLLRSALRRLPVNEALKQVESLSPDLQEDTAQFLKEYGKSGVVYDSFCRYLLEGANNCFSASGLSLDVLKDILPFDSYSGLRGVEFCFGNGEVMEVLARVGAHVTGLELNPFFVSKMRSQGLDARMAKVDEDKAKFLQRAGIEEESQDFAICGLALDRVERPKQLMENMLAVLRPKGRFAIQTLLPVVPVDDGQIDVPITYTQPENRIATNISTERHKGAIIALLSDLGAGDIRIWEFPYAVDSSDGLQEYRLWSFSGVKGSKAAQASSREHFRTMYLTGDIGCYLSDGNVKFKGRRDDQIKVRGFRIELGEIEAALHAHPALVKAAVIAFREPEDQNHRLVAFVVANITSTPISAELQQWLGKKLPDYMVPRKFSFLHDLPYLSSGKLDHQALLALARSRSSSGASLASPQTDMEKTIASIWQAALQADEVGLDDNFLEIGGHSLLMVEVAAKLQKALQLEVMVTELFEYPTVRILARHLSGGKEPAAAAATEVRERAFKQRQAQQARDQARQQHT